MKKIYGGDECLCPREKASFIILPVPFEATTSYIKGTKNGPAAIIEASSYVELYDQELKNEPYQAGLYTAKPLRGKGSRDWLKVIADAVKKILEENKVPVILGGEHTVSLGAITGYLNVGINNLSVLQFDAHADLRDSFEGTKLSHACVARRITEKCSLTQIGIRSFSNEEAKFKEKSPVTTFEASSTVTDNTVREIIASLKEKVYVTIDLDVFDPAFVPAVGTPEPGGLNWYEVLRILRAVRQERKIIGFDVVELCPIKGQIASDFLAAKLIYKLIGYVGKRGGL